MEDGVIEESHSEWSAPIVIVKENDGTLQLCVNYHWLNSISMIDAYSMPWIDELIDRLGRANFINTMDLIRGYWQVPVPEEAKSKTAFVTPFGLFQLDVMPFGTPATFHRLMDHVIQGLGLQDCAVAYLDDLIILSTCWTDHLKHLSTILQRLGEDGLTVKLTKYQFSMKECVYLGHIVESGNVKQDPGKIETIRKFSIPRT